MRFISHLHRPTTMLWMLLVAFVLSGCGGQSQDAPMFRANPARTGVFPSNGPTRLNELAWKFKIGGWVNPSPAVVDGVVYVGSSDGRLYAIDAKTGQEKWSFKIDGGTFSSPAVTGGVVYIGISGSAFDGWIYALDARTGQEKWTFETYSATSSPAVVDSTVYIASLHSWLYALDAKTGQEKWSFNTVGRIDSSPAIADGVVYVGGVIVMGPRFFSAIDLRTGQ